MKLFRLSLAVSVFLALGMVARAQVYIAADDFSAATNPIGAWSYGQEATVGGTFTLFTTQVDLSPVSDPGTILGWGAAGGFPFVALNSAATPILAGATNYPAETMAMHPDTAGNLSVLRWTAPNSGNYSISVTFFDIPSNDPATVDVHVLHNSMSLFTDSLYNVVTTTTYTSGKLVLAMGDTIDFLVGTGGNGYINDHTAINAQIMAVPEPSTFALLALGGVLVLHRTRRQRAGRA